MVAEAKDPNRKAKSWDLGWKYIVYNYII
jgi:hypothetical protein